MLLKRHWLISLLVMSGIAGGVYALWPTVAGKPVQVVTAERRELIQTVVTTGRVRPQRVRISALTRGEVIELAVQEGDDVKQGQRLLRLDDREARAALEQARAALAQSKAQNRRVTVVGVPEADEQVRQAQLRFDEAKRRVARIENLFKNNVVAEQTVEEARAATSLAASALRAAKTLRTDVGRGGAQANSSAAARKQAEAAVALAEVRLAQTEVKAAVDAVVIKRSVELGEVVQPGTALFELSAQGATELVVQPDERNLSLLKLGQPAIASAAAFDKQTFSATVSYLAPAVDSQRGTIEVRLSVPEAPDYLRPDMTVSVEIEVARRPDALTLPIESIRDMASKPWVLVMDKKRAVRRPVTLGAVGDDAVEITSGLSVGERVISNADVNIGKKVRSKKPKDPARK